MPFIAVIVGFNIWAIVELNSIPQGCKRPAAASHFLLKREK